MSKPVIEVDNLGKQYVIGENIFGRGARTFRDIFDHRLRRLLSRERRTQPANRSTIWALRNASFGVKEGEVLGIIGRNGAGKSTLLKILSRITEPTEGRAVVRGRVASLLEVGTGFSMELTGRENIYLNGAILGMKKAEVAAKFDEIVAFAEIEKFMDTPVKRYSSGMYVRLAFAVAAHLEPEILLVDEVLAVGDAAFQKKCLGKMGDVSREGQTVLFVSHNMEAIRRLCPRAMLISEGHVLLDGPSELTIGSYFKSAWERSSGLRVFHDDTAPGDNFVRLNFVRLVGSTGRTATVFTIDESFSVEIGFTVLQSVSNFHTYIRVFTQDSIVAFGSGDWDNDSVGISHFEPAQYLARCVIPGNLLNRGSYYLRVEGVIPHMRYIFAEENVLGWEISEVGGAGSAISTGRPGIFRPRLKWSVLALCSPKDGEVADTASSNR